MVATVGLLLLHVPPPELVNAVVNPAHTTNVPPIVDGNGLTVIDFVIIQPVGSVYVMILIPAVLPVTTPVAAATEALLLLLVHVPPVVVFVNKVVEPTHIVLLPPITAGNGLIVTMAVAKQPVDKE